MMIAVSIELLALFCTVAVCWGFLDNKTIKHSVTEYNNYNKNNSDYNAGNDLSSEYYAFSNYIDLNLYDRIKQDIVMGNCRPTHANLRQYNLSQDEIKLYLNELASGGVIKASGEKPIRYTVVNL